VHTCAVTQDNDVWCWGGNAFGQLGLGEIGDIQAPRCNDTGVASGCTREALQAARLSVGVQSGDVFLQWGGRTNRFESDGSFVQRLPSGSTGGVAALEPTVGPGTSASASPGATTSALAFPNGSARFFSGRVTAVASDNVGAFYLGRTLTDGTHQITRYNGTTSSGAEAWSLPTVSIDGGETRTLDLAVGRDGDRVRIYALQDSVAGPVVEVLDPSGTFVRHFRVGRAGSACEVSSDGPLAQTDPNGRWAGGLGLGADADGNAVISYVEVDRGDSDRPVLRSCVETRDARGGYIGALVSTPDSGARTGIWGDVEGSPDGDLYVADVFAGTVTKVSRDGVPVRGFGSAVFRSRPRQLTALLDPLSGLPASVFGVTDLAAGDHHTCLLLGAPTVPPGFPAPSTESRRACWGNNGAQQLGRGYSIASPAGGSGLANRFTLTTLPASATPTPSPAWGGATGFVGQLAPRGTESASQLVTASISTSSASLTSTRLIARAVSEPLPTQVLTGDVSASAGAFFENTQVRSKTGGLATARVTSANSQLTAYLLKPDGVRVPVASSLPGISSAQWGAVERIRRFPVTAVSLPAGGVAVTSGDRLVLEIGVRATVSATFTAGVPSISARFKARVGGPAGPDNSGVEGAAPDGLPWVNLSGGLRLGPPVQPPTTSFPVFAPAGDGLASNERGVQVAAGADHTCVLGDQGNVSCMGDNGLNRYAADSVVDTTERRSTQLSNPFSWSTMGVVAGGQNTCVVLGPEGYIWCFGSDASGQRGDGSSEDCIQGNVDLVGSCEIQAYLTSVTALSVGADHACGAVGGTQLFCWGSNTSRQVTPEGVNRVSNATPVEFTAALASLSTLSSAMQWATRPSPNGGSMAVERQPGATVSTTFTGSSVGWRTVTGPGQGKARVVIDGATVATVDNRSATLATTTRWFRGLSDGRHTLTIRVLDSRRPDGTNRAVAVRGFSLPNDPRGSLAATSSAVRYRWGPGSAPRSVTSDIAGASIAGRFSGTGLSVTRLVGNGQGDARLVIDGERSVLLPTTATGTTRAVTVPVDGLADSAHTYRLEVLGSGGSTGSAVTIVRLEATP
jgi:hypothetical protein